MTASIDDKLPEAFTGGEKGSSLNTSQQDSADFTDAEWALDKAAVRRLDWTVLPLCAITYLLNFLDRSKYVRPLRPTSPASSSRHAFRPVSYTHLTLPTIYSV